MVRPGLPSFILNLDLKLTRQKKKGLKSRVPSDHHLLDLITQQRSLFIFLPGSGVLAVLLVATFLQPIKDVQEKSKGEEKSSSFWSTLLSTFKLLRDKRLCLLILLPVYSGFQQAFLSGDYTRVREQARSQVHVPRCTATPTWVWRSLGHLP